MPSGNNKLDWSPKNGKIEKTAATGAVAEVDELLAAAKSVVKAQAIEVCPISDEKSESGDLDSGSPAVGNLDDGKPVDIKDALEKVEVAVEEAKEVAGVDEVEIEVSEESPSAEIEIEVGEDGGDKGGEDIVIESKPETEACMASKKGVNPFAKKDEKKDEKKCDECKKTPCECKKEASVELTMPKSAASAEEFCKFAMISPENKKKIKAYWINDLGYPADFVNLMIKDYEK